MTAEFLRFGSAEHGLMLLVLVVARAADFLSTWTATPRLYLEANPVARALGWRRGMVLNLAICVPVAAWPLPAVVLSTTSLLVAARNFQAAWISRSLGELRYRAWLGERLRETSRGVFVGCLAAQSLVYAGLGAALIWRWNHDAVVLGIGIGFLGYAIVVPLFTSLGVRGLLRRNTTVFEVQHSTHVFTHSDGVSGPGGPGKSDSGLSSTAGRL